MKYIRFAAVLVGFFIAGSAANAGDYPASNFQPKVIFSSTEAVSSTSASTPCTPKAEETAIDPKYPAASFQPKVIYSSTDAK